MNAGQSIFLVELPSRTPVRAKLLSSISEEQIEDWERHWQPFFEQRMKELADKGLTRPQSSHWNWKGKKQRVAGLLASRGFSVTCDGCTQGMMLVDLNHVARIPSQLRKPLVYVDYLEVAPWNQPMVVSTPRLAGVGSALIDAAIALSFEQNFHGRIGLHSLPQADTFYREKCGMVCVGPDSAYQNLNYFEMTAKQAKAFLEHGDAQ
jgi:hypothetical protein